MLKGICAAAVISLVGSPNFAQASDKEKFDNWLFEYINPQNEDNSPFCGASRSYSNGRFMVRLYDDVMDFFFIRNDFALPRDTSLGSLIFDFGNQSFILRAYSGDILNDGETKVDYLFIYADLDDYAGIFNSLKSGKKLTIRFPDGTTNLIGLNGSAAALDRASECWSERATGDIERTNPFENSDPPKPAANVNPFDA